MCIVTYVSLDACLSLSPSSIPISLSHVQNHSVVFCVHSISVWVFFFVLLFCLCFYFIFRHFISFPFWSWSSLPFVSVTAPVTSFILLFTNLLCLMFWFESIYLAPYKSTEQTQYIYKYIYVHWTDDLWPTIDEHNHVRSSSTNTYPNRIQLTSEVNRKDTWDENNQTKMNRILYTYTFFFKHKNLFGHYWFPKIDDVDDDDNNNRRRMGGERGEVCRKNYMFLCRCKLNIFVFLPPPPFSQFSIDNIPFGTVIRLFQNKMTQVKQTKKKQRKNENRKCRT